MTFLRSRRNILRAGSTEHDFLTAIDEHMIRDEFRAVPLEQSPRMKGQDSERHLRIIIGSQSKWRQQSLANWGYDFEVMLADIDEKQVRSNDPRQLTRSLAHAKADALLPRINEPALLITSDQVTVCNERILEKPESPEALKDFLRGYEHH